MNKHSFEVLHEQFLSKFKIGRGPGEARFGAATTYVKSTQQFMLTTYETSTSVRVKEALIGLTGDKASRDYEVGWVTSRYANADFEYNSFPNRKKYLIVFFSRNEGFINVDRRSVAMETKERGITTFVIPFGQAVAKEVAELVLDNDDNIYKITSLGALEQSMVLARMAERIKSEGCPVGGRGFSTVQERTSSRSTTTLFMILSSHHLAQLLRYFMQGVSVSSELNL
uniref:VWFA domain-containing protein n=1 Tax=Steinernema glaseri TaxID=37863 RepID=A0A1I7XWM3_9BILA